MSPIGKKLIFGSVVKVNVMVSLQEMNVSLCNVPTSDLGQRVCACVCVSASVCPRPQTHSLRWKGRERRGRNH